jgi:acetyl esterase/lipase
MNGMTIAGFLTGVRRRTVPLAACCCMLASMRPASAGEGEGVERDVSYLGEGRAEKLDLYQPAGRAPGVLSPAVVIIHGGGWQGGDKGAKREQVTGAALAKAGYVAVSVNYWLRDRGRWPTNLHDCKNAVKWLRVNAARLRVDPERIGVIGGSAGGHLALMVAYTAGDPRLDPKEPYPGVSDRVSACVDMYGVANLLTRKQTKPDGTPLDEWKGHALFPESREQDPEKWRLASPVAHLSAKSPPTLILHGTNDNVVDRDQSKELEQALRAAGAEVKLVMVPGATHAWALKTEKFDLRDEVVGFFDKHLKPNGGGRRDPPR